MSKVKELEGYACPKCNWSDVYPTENCPRCNSKTVQTTFSPHGKVATFTVVRYPPQGFEQQAPYVVGLIDLDKGPRIMGRINANPEEMQIGHAVRFIRKEEGALEFEI